MDSLTLDLPILAIAGAVQGFNFLADGLGDQPDLRTCFEIGL